MIYYEQRGSGRSAAPESKQAYTIPELLLDLKELIAWLGVEKVDLLGYSFGGELTLEFAYKYPELCRKLIVSAPSLLGTKMTDVHQITGFLTVAEMDFQKQIRNWIDKGFGVATLVDLIWSHGDQETVDHFLFQNQEKARLNRSIWEESGLRNTGLMAKVVKESPMPIPLVERLNQIHNPALILTGIFDRNTGIPISTLIHRELPNSKWVLFEESAHFPDIEETEKFVSQVIRFLKEAVEIIN